MDEAHLVGLSARLQNYTCNLFISFILSGDLISTQIQWEGTGSFPEHAVA